MVNPKDNNPYERVQKGKYYYYINTGIYGEFKVYVSEELLDVVDNSRFEKGNYYKNKEFAEQVAMGMNLEQRLRKFTYENGWSDKLWEDEFINKWYIAYDYHDCEFGVKSSRLFKQQGTIYFVSEEVAQRAIDEIIKPLNKWYIAYDYHDCEFGVKSSRLFKQQGTIYFVSEEVAQRAIDEIIKPFIEENPTFIW